MYKIYCDGASRSNPGNASIGISIQKNNIEIDNISKKIGIASNNVAEYQSLIEALNYCFQNKIDVVEIFLDSKLVVEQMNKNYRVKSENLINLYNDAQKLVSKIPNVKLTHIKREFNKRADQLANEALDKK
ncbi:MAG: ribonuclease HI family protein [Actinomycetota bacterium]|nr:ribonuclease HI family protein [Actinomycetota bacterium]MDA3012917.1 ribonuclease HI family protein [Actinomycetota bacterium]